MNRMASAYITHHSDHGARNWDIIVVRMMSVVFIAGMGCRAGDVKRAAMWDGIQFLQWTHGDLTFENTDIDNDKEPCFEKPRAHIVFEYIKNHKDKADETLNIYLRPLDNSRYQHLCVVSWLLFHALRHGLIEGSDLQDVLSHASQRNDRKVVWSHPDWPVCAYPSTVARTRAMNNLTGLVVEMVWADTDYFAPKVRYNETVG
ncbi:MAG: hypothetical protein ASARMPREDX12_007970 [Alectoria sarmentosa]|nr:MAG: hypothetical protein ASARMPREDX12_007970 [Alectoria sarmentosa]